MPNLLMVDRATPPDDTELAMLRSLGVGALVVYCHGETAAPATAAWDGYDLGKVSDLRLLPLFVGQNLPWTTDLTAQRGVTDGDLAVATITARGFSDGPVGNDMEYQDWQQDPAGTSAYWRAMAGLIASHNRVPVGYQPLAMAQSYVGAGWGCWASWWPQTLSGVPDLGQLPVNPSRYHGLGWQFSDQFHGWDASVVDGGWWDVPASVPQVIDGFSTGFTIAGGIAQAWQHNGGIYAFGQPISHEFDTALGGHTVRLQWFERGVASWVSGQFPSEWDVEFLLLGDILRDGGDQLTELMQRRRDNDAAFHP